MDRKKIVYIGLIFIITVISSITYFSYGFLTSKNEYHGRINMIAGTLNYELRSNDFGDNNSVTVEGKKFKKIEIEVTSLNDIDSKYKLYYQTNNSNVKVGYASDTTNQPTEVLESKGTKKVTLVIRNKDVEEATVVFGVQGGFSYNEVDLEEGKNSITKPLNICSYTPGTVVKEAGYTGSANQFTVPCDGNYKVELWGAQGYKSSGGNAGEGGYVSGEIDLGEGDNLYLYIGNQGTDKVSAWNGGGVCHMSGSSYCGTSGGGGVDLRVVNGAWNNAESLRSRIMVAGSGGGAGGYNGSNQYYSTPGAGGGLIGYDSANYSSSYPGSAGATQISGGYSKYTASASVTDSYGQFGMGPQEDDGACCGAGGGSGWYGGGGGCGASASGGSAYISGHTGCVGVTSITSSSPKTGCTTGTTDKTCSISPYEYEFNYTKMIDGNGYSWTNVKGSLEAMPNPSGGYYASGRGHTGSGYARITYLGADDFTITFDTNGGNNIDAMTIRSGIPLGELPTPTRGTDVFKGWYLDNEFNTLVDSTYIPSNNITLYAKYSTCAYNPGDVVKTAGYTGAVDPFTVPCDGNYKIELWGAQGGSNRSADPPGLGAYVSGTINLETNDSFYIHVGNQGATAVAGGATPSYNGGGTTGYYSTLYEGFGGGATDIRTVAGTWDNANSLRSRIMVAAAGGGGGGSYSTYYLKGGNAGGLTGTSGTCTGSCSYSPVTGGNQTAGGSNAQNSLTGSFGISSQTKTSNGYSGGGGSGWYAGVKGYGTGGSGGSSYISGHTGCVAVTSTTSTTPKSGCTTGTTNNACSVSPYGYVFTNTKMIDGSGYSWTNKKGSLEAMPNPNGGNYASGKGNSGNGYARITYLGTD